MERTPHLLKQVHPAAEATGEPKHFDLGPTPVYAMDKTSRLSDPQDICLLLRAHGEQRWLIFEVLPVLRQIETPGSIPEDQLGAAYAYLELLWMDARRRARETDACAQLNHSVNKLDQVLYEKASRYHAAVRRLRVAIGRRIATHTHASSEPLAHQHANL
ncbi:MAG: hypothetical protein ACYDHN_00315 [Solirubrobacteraceae bacterium]